MSVDCHHLSQSSDNHQWEIYWRSITFGLTFIWVLRFPACSQLDVKQRTASTLLQASRPTLWQQTGQNQQVTNRENMSLFGKRIRCVLLACAQLTLNFDKWVRLHLISNGITTTMEFLGGSIFFLLMVISKYWTFFSKDFEYIFLYTQASGRDLPLAYVFQLIYIGFQRLYNAC